MIHLHELNETCQAIPKASEPSALLAAINEVLGPPPLLQKTQATCKAATAADSVQTIFCQGAGLRLAILMELSYNLVSERNPAALLETFAGEHAGLLTAKRHFWQWKMKRQKAVTSGIKGNKAKG